jgi:phosphoribosylglycinamide formyltransferase-1
MPSSRDARPALAVLCSGSGTNLQAILDAARRGKLKARVAVVISDRADAKALLRAKRAGVAAHAVDPKAYPSRADFERALIARIDAHKPRLVCLAGFMRILSPVFVGHYPGRILNIHPALLPSFPGAHAVKDALRWAVKVSGVTVHIVDEQVDHGPIVLQEAVAVRPGDTEQSLHQRLHRVEHRLYPEAIAMMLKGRVVVEGRVAHVGAKAR